MIDRGFVESGGARIHYEVEGTGHPLVLIHAGVANLRMWDDQVRALSDRYRCIRYDTRGFGQTETEDVEFSNRADVAAVMDHVGVDSAYLMGLSRGGVIALDFTLEQPGRVDALIFAAGGISGDESDPPDEAMRFFEELQRVEQARDWPRLADLETAYWVDGPGQSPDRVDARTRSLVHHWILSTYEAEKVTGKPQPLTPPATGRLGEIRVPTLVLVGDLDDAITQTECRRVAAEVPGARLEMFEGAAHMLNLEQPDRFNALVLEFLEEVERTR